MFDLMAFLHSGTVVATPSGSLLLGWGKRSWSRFPNNSNTPCFYFPDFFLSMAEPWFTHETVEEVSIWQLLDRLSKHPTGKRPHYQWKSSDPSFFETSFLNLKAQFTAGTLKKGVPYVFEKANGKIDSSTLTSMLKHMLSYASEQKVYAYGFWDKNEGMLGATPELLFHLNSGQLATEACAGTCRPVDLGTFRDCPKQNQEHRIVVDGIVECLKPFGDAVKHPLQIQQLPGLCHLKTPITLKTKLLPNADSILNALHPTPALGAYPKEYGMVWLKDIDKIENRGRFGAPVGIAYSAREMACYVAIRNLQWTRESLKIGTGCGVVPKSNLKDEWQELQLKTQAIKDVLGI